MATKIVLALSIVAFWLVLPIPLMLMGVGGFEELDNRDLQNQETPTSFSVLTDIAVYVGVYFKTMFFIIPNASPYILRFVNFLQLMSALVVLVMIRGN